MFIKMESGAMVDDLANIVDATLDAAIRSFCPGDESSYAHWDSELRRLELSLREAPPTPEHQNLLATVHAHRIDLAFDVEKCELVLELSAQFVRDVHAGHPSFFSVAAVRARCLHSVGAHREEVREFLELARRPEIQDGEYISLLEYLAQRHPGDIPDDEELLGKMKKAIEALRALGYETLPVDSGGMDLVRLTLQAAGELKRVNREKGEALLADTP
jgi:hypothetical protein